MKICWDNLEKIKFSTATGKFYDIRGSVTYAEFGPCIVCGEQFIDRVHSDRPRRCCSVECKRVDPQFVELRSKISREMWTSADIRDRIASSLSAIHSTSEFKNRMSEISRSVPAASRSAATSRRWQSGGFAGRELSDSSHPMWKGGYNKRGLARFDIYSPQLSPIEETRRSTDDKNILQVRCVYCGMWHTPNLHQVWNRRNFIVGTSKKEGRFYCSDRCKAECPIFGKQRYRKGQRGKEKAEEAHPTVRKMCFERDGWTCQRCGSTQSLHAHHILPRAESAILIHDLDNLVTLCSDCHEDVHRMAGCGYHEISCK